jgi:hypothetical protein
MPLLRLSALLVLLALLVLITNLQGSADLN